MIVTHGKSHGKYYKCHRKEPHQGLRDVSSLTRQTWFVPGDPYPIAQDYGLDHHLSLVLVFGVAR